MSDVARLVQSPPSGENLFMLRATEATDGTPDLAILAAYFIEMLRERPGLESVRLEPDPTTGREYILRAGGGNLVIAEPQTTRNRLRVSVYGQSDEHAGWHGESCQLSFGPAWGTSYACAFITGVSQMDDLASHIDRAWALKQHRG